MAIDKIIDWANRSNDNQILFYCALAIILCFVGAFVLYIAKWVDDPKRTMKLTMKALKKIALCVVCLFYVVFSAIAGICNALIKGTELLRDKIKGGVYYA